MINICTRTGTRREACACRCARLALPEAKHKVNKRDVLALLDLLASRVESQPHGDVTWGHVGDIAHLRGRLVEIAVDLGLGPDGDERAARRRIEGALCAEDEHVAEDLLGALAL